MQQDPTSIGPYVVERRLGRGGMGVVYVCHHPLTPRPVAVKQTLARGASEKALARFQREASLMAKLKHPGIVAVHALGQTADGPYLVMDLIDGQGLDQVVKRGPLEAKMAARLVRDLSRAVGAIHAAGIIHRDIKPGNVIMRPDGTPVLLDFGLAREVDAERLTRTGEVVGTILYMPPEQASGRNTGELDGRVDIYALGAVLYELLCGRAPYEGGGIQVLARILGPDEPPPPSSSSGSHDGVPTPAALEAIVRVAMAKDRERRYATAGALAADLDRFLAGERPAALGRLPARRWPRVAAAGAALVAAALGLGAWAAARGEPPPPSPELARTGDPPARSVVPPLWTLKADERLVYALTFEEQGGGQKIDFGCTLELVAGKPAGDAQPLTGKVLSMTCSFGVEGAKPYDSRTSDPEHPLALLQAAVGPPFTCELEPRTGRVLAMRGLDEIRPLVHAGSREALDALFKAADPTREDDFTRFVDIVFTDEFIGASMGALTHTRGEGRRIAWRQDPTGELLFRTSAGAGGGGPVLTSLTIGLDQEDRFFFAGEARYGADRLATARLTQDMVERGGRTSRMTWSMTLVE